MWYCFCWLQVSERVCAGRFYRVGTAAASQLRSLVKHKLWWQDNHLVWIMASNWSTLPVSSTLIGWYFAGRRCLALTIPTWPSSSTISPYFVRTRANTRRSRGEFIVINVLQSVLQCANCSKSIGLSGNMVPSPLYSQVLPASPGDLWEQVGSRRSQCCEN